MNIDPKRLKNISPIATVFQGKVYPIYHSKRMQANISKKTIKALFAYNAHSHTHGDACVANQILQEGFKEIKSIHSGVK